MRKLTIISLLSAALLITMPAFAGDGHKHNGGHKGVHKKHHKHKNDPHLYGPMDTVHRVLRHTFIDGSPRVSIYYDDGYRPYRHYRRHHRHDHRWHHRRHHRHGWHHGHRRGHRWHHGWRHGHGHHGHKWHHKRHRRHHGHEHYSGHNRKGGAYIGGHIYLD